MQEFSAESLAAGGVRPRSCVLHASLVSMSLDHMPKPVSIPQYQTLSICTSEQSPSQRQLCRTKRLFSVNEWTPPNTHISADAISSTHHEHTDEGDQSSEHRTSRDFFSLQCTTGSFLVPLVKTTNACRGSARCT